MGTNYYASITGTPCPHCGHDPDARELHIGKSSGGWCFSLHVFSDEEEGMPLSWADWKALLQQDGVTIRDEYGSPVSFEEMSRVVENRSWKFSSKDPDWYTRNHAEPGPNNLARHKIGRWCVGHGAGTWDLIPGRFS